MYTAYFKHYLSQKAYAKVVNKQNSTT